MSMWPRSYFKFFPLSFFFSFSVTNSVSVRLCSEPYFTLFPSLTVVRACMKMKSSSRDS